MKNRNKRSDNSHENRSNNKPATALSTNNAVSPEKFAAICRLNQEDLYDMLSKTLDEQYGAENVADAGDFIYAKGTFPVLLVAHLDTVHKDLPADIYIDDARIMSSPQGIGGDDRCGVYMILDIIKEYKCSVLFTKDEEIGGIGASVFAEYVEIRDNASDFGVKYIIEFDRANSRDAVFYDCDNKDFTKFITESFYKEAVGTFSDICYIAPSLKVAAVNLSCGYYRAHTLNEYVAIDEMQDSINAAKSILAKTTDDVGAFEYVECRYLYGYGYGSRMAEKYGPYYDTHGMYDSGMYGYGNGYDYDCEDYYDGKDLRVSSYYISYIDDADEFETEVDAVSMEEAVGIFLMTHPDITYSSIVDVYENTKPPAKK